MKILFLGDIFGDAGLLAVKKLVPPLCAEQKIDLVVANCENAVGGLGITPKVAEELFSLPIHVLTSGNHLFHYKEILDYLPRQPKLLRPANYLSVCPGAGSWSGEIYAGIRVGVINLIGQVYMAPANNPFEAVERELEKIRYGSDLILVDMHAEASSEKIAMGWFLDGRVAAVVGTHTHVQTADERILPQGTAYITDLGMTGPYDSVIGMNREEAVVKFKTGIQNRLRPATGDVRLSGVILDIEESTGKARSIQRIQRGWK